MTEKLYYKDIYKIEFEANVVDLIQEKKAWKVLLNKTCFFPEGGGQPPDKGWINNIPVIDVQKEGDFIYHYLPENPGEDKIMGKIDLEWRKDFMQQHTGQHIISGALWKVGNYKTVSVHMGMDYTTIEIDSPEISEEDLINTERLANQVIQSDMPVRFIQANHQEIDQFHLRKPCTRKGNIRLVKIGDFDCVACGGLHFDRTRNVELVKATGIEKIRGNVRITWKIGDRAFEDYRKKDKIITSLRSVLSTNEDMFVQKTREIQEEIINYKKKCNKFENRLAETIAQNLYTYRDQQNQERSTCRLITESREGENDSLMMKIMKSLLKRGSVLVCLVNTFSNKLQWCIGCSDDIHFPFDKIKDELLSIIGGKGGGRAPIWQGTGVKPERADDFLSKFRALALDLNLY
jgi:alanyl-tRNA synthetase